VNRKELFEHHRNICNEALDIMIKKNHDYAGEGGDSPFANFTRSEDMGICTTEQGFLVRLCDKLSRLSTFASAGELKVDNESYHDAIVDIINYCVLFDGFVSTKKD
tara:strand:+ start:339 stop:656 length:318 start_codon:yes stop_codon:yes gene_type:complete